MFKIVHLTFSALFLFLSCYGFHFTPKYGRFPVGMRQGSSRLNLKDNDEISIAKTVFTPKFYQSLLTISLMSIIMPSTSVDMKAIIDHGSIATVFQPTPVLAEYRAAQKSTYFRTVPKLITGRDYYRKEIKNAIEKEQWDVISKFFERYPSKINKNDPNQIDAYDTYVNKYLYRPLKLLTSSFAEKGVSAKQQELLEKEQAFELAMDDLEGCIKDRKKGFFGTTIKAPTGKERKEQASRAYEAGNKALDEFVQLLNNGLMLELNKIPL